MVPGMNKIVELFGLATGKRDVNWQRIVSDQQCVYTGKTCYKVRKSDPDISIGTCTVLYGRDDNPVIICPTRLTERHQIFTDCLHLLTTHEPGNELHIVPEITVPGGSVDYFLVSVQGDKIKDFVGIELQTLDTTGTVWPERQRLLKDLGVPRNDKAENSNKSYGMNWKHTAKTILVQMHHKIGTFEHINKKLVLVVQDHLLSYMAKEFSFDHLHTPARNGDSMHIHSYRLEAQADQSFKLRFASRASTDAEGVAVCLGLQAEAKVELQQIISVLAAKISPDTLFRPV